MLPKTDTFLLKIWDDVKLKKLPESVVGSVLRNSFSIWTKACFFTNQNANTQDTHQKSTHFFHYASSEL